MRGEAVRRRAARARAPSVVATLAVVLLFSGMALRDLNGLLQGMRAADGISYSIGSLAAVSKLPDDAAQQAARVVGTWHRHAADQVTLVPPKPVDARHVVHVHVAVDMLFALAYCAAFWLFFRSTARKLASDLVGRLARVGTVGVAVTLATDLIENVAEWKVVGRGWAQLDAGASVEALRLGGWATVLWLAAIFKWLSLALVVLPVFVGLSVDRLRAWRSQDGGAAASSVWHALWRLRVQLVVVVALLALLLGHEQMPDVIRAWSTGQLGWALLTTAVLTLTVWVSSRLLLGVGVPPNGAAVALPDEDGTPPGGDPPDGGPPAASATQALPGAPPAVQGWWPYWVALACVVACGALWAVDKWTSRDVGWGWAIRARVWGWWR